MDKPLQTPFPKWTAHLFLKVNLPRDFLRGLLISHKVLMKSSCKRQSSTNPSTYPSCSNDKGEVDEFVRKLTFAMQLYAHFLCDKFSSSVSKGRCSSPPRHTSAELATLVPWWTHTHGKSFSPGHTRRHTRSVLGPPPPTPSVSARWTTWASR
jgi:hypothetical protein